MCLLKPTPTPGILRTRGALIPLVEPCSLCNFYHLFFHTGLHSLWFMTFLCSPSAPARSYQCSTHRQYHLQGITVICRNRDFTHIPQGPDRTAQLFQRKGFPYLEILKQERSILTFFCTSLFTFSLKESLFFVDLVLN